MIRYSSSHIFRYQDIIENSETVSDTIAKVEKIHSDKECRDMAMDRSNIQHHMDNQDHGGQAGDLSNQLLDQEKVLT